MRKRSRIIEDYIPQELKIYEFGEGSPRVFVTAGLHGGESTGIYAANKLLEFLQHSPLKKGSVRILPVGNPAAFRRLQRTSPYDELDLNRSFPGKRDSVPTLGVADAIWEEAQDADYIVDLHCCGVYGASYTLAVYQEYDFARELASQLAIPRVIQSGGTRGQLFTDACAMGIPAVIIELPGGGQGGVIDIPAGDHCFDALVGLLRQFDMVEGTPNKPEPVFYGPLQPVTCEKDGLWLPALKPGTPISSGDIIGTLDGESVTCTVDGTTMMMRPPSYVFKGTPLASVAARA
jgi:predicted deacylase